MMVLLARPGKAGSRPAMADDPRRPPNTHPVPGSQWNWTDDVPGHTIVRSSWGNWSNYDLAKADRYPIPDVLTLKNGGRVTDAATWWSKRRPEILGDFQSEVYGRIPAQTPGVTWEVMGTEMGVLNATANLRHIVGHIDNSGYPAASPSINISLYLPASAKGPVPVMVVASWNSTGKGFGPPPSGPTAMEQVIAHGWGFAFVNTYAIQMDSGAGLNVGIIGLVNKGRPRKPDDWGALAAWSWGLSRAIDYFETDKGCGTPSASATRGIRAGARRAALSPRRSSRAGRSSTQAARANAARSSTGTTWASPWTTSAAPESTTGWRATS